jgi:hypothetical protein
VRGTVQGTAAYAAHTRLETALPHQPRRRLVIGVTIDAVRGEDGAWPGVADHLDHQCDRLARACDLAIWEAERDPLAELEVPRRRSPLRGATGWGTPSCPLSIGQVGYTDSQSSPRRKRQGATAADLRIVGVSGKSEDLERLHLSAPGDNSPSGCPPPDGCRPGRGR